MSNADVVMLLANILVGMLLVGMYANDRYSKFKNKLIEQGKEELFIRLNGLYPESLQKCIYIDTACYNIQRWDRKKLREILNLKKETTI